MADWLKRIQDPRDIRGLSIDQLGEIAEQIRDTILRVTAVNGGHLASSMGVVELTLALHHTFNTPEDKLVWDVGHQTYPHKLITGRAERFSTIRKYGGLSGFLKLSESPYDAWGAGHASTSLSAALGMAIARDRIGADHRIVAVIGDGSMTGGTSYEALNHIGDLSPDLLVILNDNEMSISPNVGAMARYFNRILTTDIYNEGRRDVLDWIKRLPAGERLIEMTNRVEESVKGLIVPGLLFEELGLRYLGPFDGHNLEELIPLLQKVRTLRGPILLHLTTVKGKGRDYAEANPIRYHSPPLNFDSESGQAPPSKPGPPNFTKLFAESLRREMRRDERIVAITAAMLEGTGLVALQDEFGERVYDVGIAEEHGTICAGGLALGGQRPFVCIYSTFLQRAFDMIIHDVALQKLPVAFALDRGGLVGSDGPTHHGVFDISYLRMVPDLVVMAARNGRELRSMVHTAAVYEDGPIALRYPRASISDDVDLDAAPEVLEIGRGAVLREGEDICLIGIGLMAEHALQAATQLEREGVRVGVIDARFIKPLDRELLLEAAARYRCLVTIEDNVLAGGFGSAVLELINDAAPASEALRTHTPEIVRIGLPDRFIEHGSLTRLHAEYGLSPQALAERVRALRGRFSELHELA